MELKPLSSVVSDYVNDEIDRNNYTQRQFAKISPISQSTLVKIVSHNEKAGINSRSIDTILKSTNTSLTELFEKYGEYK